MELKPNMYVRTKDGRIDKIEDIRNDFIYTENSDYGYRKDYFKASHNIIDLIEVGDYVNGYPVYEIVEYEDNTRAIVIGDDNKSIIWEESSQYVKSIVTKEQFSSISYEVSK